jgi:erythromycin esterase-like protein
MSAITFDALGAIRDALLPVSGSEGLDPILETNGDASLVLIGEASHGTHEFYALRARLTQRLIHEMGFCAVAVEADWPDAYRVNRFVRGISADPDARTALEDFKRFPQWMWRNTVVLEFLEWLRRHNETADLPAGFYGLDLYSLYRSIQAVLKFLDKADPKAAARARFRYGCFEEFRENAQAYGYAAGFDISKSCEDNAVHQMLETRKRAAEFSSRDGALADDEAFFAEESARLVVNAEEYYREMFRGRVSSWNLRDSHMSETLEHLLRHLRERGPAKIVVWEHNSHLGDARATEMGEQGEFNVGQRVREHHPGDAVLIGFSTYTGTVTAASSWDGPAERKRVRPALPESYEKLFHQAAAESCPDFVLRLDRNSPAVQALCEPRLQRAIGVIYRPETERTSHYFRVNLPRQFDVLIHLDQTRALEPLERTPIWDREEAPETYPFGV